MGPCIAHKNICGQSRASLRRSSEVVDLSCIPFESPDQNHLGQSHGLPETPSALTLMNVSLQGKGSTHSQLPEFKLW